VVKNRARDLLRAVADYGDVSIATIHDFARLVIKAPPFRVAQEILRGGSPEFAVRKALELASTVPSGGVGNRTHSKWRDQARESATIALRISVLRTYWAWTGMNPLVR